MPKARAFYQPLPANRKPVERKRSSVILFGVRERVSKPYRFAIAAAVGFFLGVVLWNVAAHGRPSTQWDFAQLVEKFGEDEARARSEFFKAGTLPSKNGDVRVSCCGEADAYEADDYEIDKDGNLVAILTCNDPRDCEYLDQPPPVYDNESGDYVTSGNTKIKRSAGTRFIVPPMMVLRPYNPVNKTGHGWLFIGSGDKVLCYGPASGF